MQEISFAALEKHESPRQRRKWQKHFAKRQPKRFRTLRAIAAIITVLIVFIFLFIIVGVILAIVSNILKGFTVIPVIGLIIWVTIYVIRKNRRLNQTMAVFANDNGWQVMNQDPTFELAAITPNDSTTSIDYPGPALSGTLDGCTFWLYGYRCSVSRRDSNGNSHDETVVSCSVLTVELPEALPTFFLDATADWQQKQPQGLFTKGMQKLSLEGNFDDYFTLYQAPDTQIDVLSIITPEFMQKLIDSGAYLNVEADGKYIHFISTYGNLLDFTPTRYLLEQSRIVLAAILFKLDRYEPSENTISTP